MKGKTFTALLVGALFLLPSTLLHGQASQRLKSVLTENPDGGSYVPVDSTHYFWAVGEGAESTDFREFPYKFYGWYLHYAIAIPDFIKDEITGRDVKTERIAYAWIDSINAFKQWIKVTYELDAQGKILLREQKLDDGAGGWKKSRKDEYEYQTNGEISLFKSYVSPLGVNWEKDSKFEIDYNGNDDVLRVIKYQGLSSQQWRPKNKDTFIYNGSNLVQKWGSEWDYVAAEWKNQLEDSFIYHYNSSGYCDTVTKYSVLHVNSIVELDEVISYRYNTQGNATRVILRNTNNLARVLKPYYKVEYSYNSSYPTEEIGYTWNSSNNDFDNNRKWVFSYEGNLLKRIDAKEWDTQTDDWLPSSTGYFGRRTTFFYEDVDSTSGINSISPTFNFRMYPNPSSDKIHIEVAGRSIQNVRIINLAGQTVFKNQKTLSAQTITVPVSQLAPGVYYLKITSGNAQAVKSFVVK